MPDVYGDNDRLIGKRVDLGNGRSAFIPGSIALAADGDGVLSTLPAGADRSGTASTTSSTLAPANASRRSLNIQNISANTLGINEFGGTAAIGTPGTYTLAAGGTLNVRTRNAVTVIASAASSPYTATEA